jgi:hypothetical protein
MSSANMIESQEVRPRRSDWLIRLDILPQAVGRPFRFLSKEVEW